MPGFGFRLPHCGLWSRLHHSSALDQRDARWSARVHFRGQARPIQHDPSRWWRHWRVQGQCSSDFTRVVCLHWMHSWAVPSPGTNIFVPFNLPMLFFRFTISWQINFPMCTIAHTPRLPAHCVEFVRVFLWPQEKPFGGLKSRRSNILQSLL